MEGLVQFTCENAQSAHWFFILLIFLAGLNVPISIDAVLISAGALASTCSPSQTYTLFIWLFFACWIAAWEAYWIGRLLGPKLYDIRWFSHILTLKRIERLHHYYETFGFLTFMVGRFIPGGVRNALFMTSGLGKMPFHKFILRDFPACLLSCGVLFYLGYVFGLNYNIIIKYFKTYNIAVLFVIGLSVVLYFSFIWLRKNKISQAKGPSSKENRDF